VRVRCQSVDAEVQVSISEEVAVALSVAEASGDAISSKEMEEFIWKKAQTRITIFSAQQVG
jgi:hypothetical protein